MDSAILIELLDTSLKVALGAAIAGLAGWLVLRRDTLVGPKAARENRRLSILEQVSSQVGVVTHCFAKYATLAAESVQFGERWPRERRQELEAISAELVTEFKRLADAESKLLMLGEKNLERCLRIYGGKIALYRKQVYLGRTDISLEQVGAIKYEVAQAREKFYDMLSRKYDQLLANA